MNNCFETDFADKTIFENDKGDTQLISDPKVLSRAVKDKVGEFQVCESGLNSNAAVEQ